MTATRLPHRTTINNAIHPIKKGALAPFFMATHALLHEGLLETECLDGKAFPIVELVRLFTLGT